MRTPIQWRDLKMRPSRWARLLGLIGEVLPFLFSKRGWVRTILARHGRTFIRDVRGGARVKIIGQARPVAEQVTAPFSGERCVYFRAEVWETIETSEETSSKLLAALDDCRDVIIADGTGEAHVRMKRAAVSVPQQQDNRFREKGEEYVRRLGYDPLSKRLTYSEGVVRDGATLAVLGTATVEVTRSGGGEPYRGTTVQPTFPATLDDRLIVSGAFEDWIDYAIADQRQSGSVRTPPR